MVVLDKDFVCIDAGAGGDVTGGFDNDTMITIR